MIISRAALVCEVVFHQLKTIDTLKAIPVPIAIIQSKILSIFHRAGIDQALTP